MLVGLYAPGLKPEPARIASAGHEVGSLAGELMMRPP
jgi:hypothetical protein